MRRQAGNGICDRILMINFNSQQTALMRDGLLSDAGPSG
jgi:hypothetical protein